MALFGKKKTAEKSAPQINPEEDIQMVGGDAATHSDETDGEDLSSGPAIDFDAIAQDLHAHEDGADMDSFLGKTGAQNAGEAFDETPDFATHNDAAVNLDDELDFDSTFDNGSPAPITMDAPAVTGENPFGNAPNIEPVTPEPTLTTHAPPLTYTAPILTSDIAASGGAPAVRRSSPLLPLLGVVALLAALGGVGWLVFGGASRPETAAPIVAASPSLQSPGGAIVPGGNAPNGVAIGSSVPAPGAPSGAVNQGIAVDGVPIAPGVIVAQAPIGALAPRGSLTPRGAATIAVATSSVPPALAKQLAALWKKGADAKHAGNIAGARAAWTQMLRLRPNHPGVQEALDKLPAR